MLCSKTMASAKEGQKNPIQVIERMMKLLDLLAEHPEPMGLKQISQISGLHPSTAHRILAAMAAEHSTVAIYSENAEPWNYAATL